VTPHRLHVVPWLRSIGSLVLRDWLAITIGSRIFAWRTLNDAELAHELAHVRQWSRHGVAFPLIYLAHSLRLRRAGKRWYHDNPYEKEARDAARRQAPGPSKD
jgi:hypothetical protein